MATNFSFNLNLNTQQFQTAIGTVGRQARNLFDQLQQYSQQYQRTGFLGTGDQRMLLQTMQHWERMTRQVRLEQLGIQGQMQQLQATGPMTQAQTQQFQRLQAQAQSLQAREQGLQTLQGGFTNWQAMQQQLLAAQQAQAQGGGGGANLRGYAAAAGIGLLQRTGPVGQIAGAALTGGAIAGLPGALIGGGAALAGVAFDKAREAMDAWVQRARGVAAVGQLLDQNFGAITSEVISLRDQFTFLTADSLAAMEAMSRFTGRRDPAALTRALGFARAYGMEPAQAAGLAGAMQMLGAPAANPLAAVAAGARNAYGGGRLPMRMDLLQEEAARIAGIGGTAAPPMDPEFYGRLLGFVGGMGPRYQLPGAAAGFAERFAQGVSQAPDDAVLMMRHRAIEQLYQQRKAAGLPTTLEIGRGPYREQADLGSYEGRRIAMELAAQSPEVLGAYTRTTQQEFGFDPELAALGFERIVGGGRLGPTEARRTRRRLEAGGGPEAIFTGPGRFTEAGEAATAQGRVGTWQQAMESLPQRVDAGFQTLFEKWGTEGLLGVNAPKWLELQLKSAEAMGELDKAIRDQFSALGQAINTHFPALTSKLEEVVQKIPAILAGQAITPSDQPLAGPLQGLHEPLLDWTADLLDKIRNDFRQRILGWQALQPSRTR
jgi:hypothetical protein